MKNYQIILQGAAEAPTGEGFDLVTIIADTAADMPDPDPKWAAGSELYVLENGGAKYRLTNSREWLECSFDAGGGGVTEEYVMQKIAEAQLSGGEVDLSAYPARTEVEEMIADAHTDTANDIAAVRQEMADSQVNMENDIAGLQNDTTTLRMDCDNVMQDMEQIMQEQTQLADDVEAIMTKVTATAFPSQDASVEGIWMKYAEFAFPLESNYESTDAVFLVRNRVVQESPALGILAARLRYDRAGMRFQFASLRWLQGFIGIDPQAFALCYNPEEARVELYVRCDAAYIGFVFTAIAMGTSKIPHDMTAWNLEDATEGIAELPLAEFGWTTIFSQP